MVCAPSKLQIWVNIVDGFFCLFVWFSLPLFSSALKLGQASPSHGGSFQSELPKCLLCCGRGQYRWHARKLIEKRLTCFKACWELGARQKPKVLKPRQTPVCYKKATHAHMSSSWPIRACWASKDSFFVHIHNCFNFSFKITFIIFLYLFI